jgi:deoxyxylulose-5-phosphate synthase
VFVVEETAEHSGIHQQIAYALGENTPVIGMHLGSKYVPHGAVKELYRLCGLDSDAIATRVRKEIRNES